MTANVRTGKGEPAVLTALAAGASIVAAARHGGVSERTVRRRLEDDDYAEAVRAARREMFERALGILAAGTSRASTTLLALLEAEAEHVRLGAASRVLEHAARLHDHVEVSTRLATLEARIAELDAERRERDRPEPVAPYPRRTA